MKKETFEVIIIGGGAAGLSAALWCDELGLSAVLLETENELGGQLLWIYNAIKNHLGIEAQDGRELQRIFQRQLEHRRFIIKTNSRVVKIDAENKQINLASGEILSGRVLILATGIRRRKLNLEGEEKLKGHGILESGQRDAPKVIGKTVCIVGGGDAALENALILSESAEKVILIHRRKEFRARSEFVEKVKQNQKIEILSDSVVTRLVGCEMLEAIEVNNEKYIPTDALLLRLGVVPNTELFEAQLKLDEAGYCQIDAAHETSQKNVFAIGDVANPLAPTISGAVGMGATAAKIIYERSRRFWS